MFRLKADGVVSPEAVARRCLIQNYRAAAHEACDRAAYVAGLPWTESLIDLLFDLTADVGSFNARNPGLAITAVDLGIAPKRG